MTSSKLYLNIDSLIVIDKIETMNIPWIVPWHHKIETNLHASFCSKIALFLLRSALVNMWIFSLNSDPNVSCFLRILHLIKERVKQYLLWINQNVYFCFTFWSNEPCKPCTIFHNWLSQYVFDSCRCRLHFF